MRVTWLVARCAHVLIPRSCRGRKGRSTSYFPMLRRMLRRKESGYGRTLLIIRFVFDVRQVLSPLKKIESTIARNQFLPFVFRVIYQTFFFTLTGSFGSSLYAWIRRLHVCLIRRVPRRGQSRLSSHVWHKRKNVLHKSSNFSVGKRFWIIRLVITWISFLFVVVCYIVKKNIFALSRLYHWTWSSAKPEKSLFRSGLLPHTAYPQVK